ncbi:MULTISPECIES: hypothetical protein [Trichocoleus]|uniref:Uncharacterized protein n=1 Tax=Trichocoleus desertorum GB2-A4 TaxID=2933944 RepID=A0ABV0JEK7_9CYAN|nr:hypothetical protein [Trichocoleus sp. FACHB-46]MBD1862410.1 hypothetical protein [Trichocoleus sp. FACHB-46]
MMQMRGEAATYPAQKVYPAIGLFWLKQQNIENTKVSPAKTLPWCSLI